jgi:predicted transcriptional regulator of viral defense system
MVTKSVKLGPMETKLLFTLEEQGIRLFNISLARKLLKASAPSAREVLFRLKRKSRITELEKGKYVLNPAKSGLGGHWAEDAYLVTEHLIREYYVGFWSALSYWSLTEQIPSILLIATPLRKKKMEVEYGGQTIRFIRISKNRFFGFVEQSIEGGQFKVASREKAILDALTYPQHCGGLTEAAKALWNGREDIDWDLLLHYLDKLDTDSVKRRLGYVLQTLGIQKAIQKKFRSGFTGFRWLDPSAPKANKGYSREWGLQLNLTKDELLCWRAS